MNKSEAAILEAIQLIQPATIADIVEKTGLSRSGIYKLVQGLQKAGEVYVGSFEKTKFNRAPRYRIGSEESLTEYPDARVINYITGPITHPLLNEFRKNSGNPFAVAMAQLQH